jgi:hypothetical protein
MTAIIDTPWSEEMTEAMYKAIITNQSTEMQQITADEKPAIIAAPATVPETITDIVVKTVKSFIPKYTIIEEIFNPVTKSWLQVPA